MSKHLKNSTAWIVFASFATAAAIWQAQISVATDLKARHQTLPPPQKTRHAIRPLPVPWSGDFVGDYTRRCQTGLTERQIGWIIEDFKTAGLDQGIRVAPREEYLAQRQAQHRWYHDALAEGLRLTPEQSAQASARLAERFDQAKADFIEALATAPRPFEHQGKWYVVTGTAPIELLISPKLWMLDPAAGLMPWDLCQLAPGQEQITWKRWYENQEDEASFLLPRPVITDGYGFQNLAPARLLAANSILPFLSGQEFKPAADPLVTGTDQAVDLVSQVKTLHPAQLKILLLLEPAMAVQIEQALEIASR
jgi:hypothetical protein